MNLSPCIANHRRGALVLVVALLAVGLLFSMTGTVAAHERRTVGGGKYTFVVGFLNEPALIEEMNGVSLVVTTAADNKPVEGVEKTLKVDVTAGTATKTFDLKIDTRRDGAYKAEFIPTKTGPYAFRFYGTIAGTAIDDKFESGPNRFDEVASKASVEFPTAVPSAGELASQVAQLQGSGQAGSRPAEAATPAAPAGDIQKALDEAQSARTTGLVAGGIGILVGLAGVAVGLMALRRRDSAPGGPSGGTASGGRGGGAEPI